MADFRFVQTKFWTDPYVATLAPLEAYYYLWLFTNPHVDQCGAVNVSEGVIMAETRLNEAEIRAAQARLEADGKILRHAGVIWIVNFHKHQSTSSPLLLKRVHKDLARLGSSPLVQAFMDKYADSLKPKEEEKSEDKKNEEKGRDRKVSDTVLDTVSTPIPKNLPFELRDQIVKLRLDRKDLTLKAERMRAKGEVRDRLGRSLEAVESDIARIDLNIRTIIEANR